MKPLKDLTFGFTDAENYRRRENKNIFSQIFLRTDALESLTDPSTFFLIGEKGTGKTAYAVYLSNNHDDKNKYYHRFIRESDYLKFVALKEKSALDLSEFTDIWKVILLVLFSGSIIENEAASWLGNTKSDFLPLKAAIDEYYKNAFSPEIVSGLQIVENAELMIKLLAKHSGVSLDVESSDRQTKTSEKKRFQTDLLSIQHSFEHAISSVKLKFSHTLFIDGIDIRPEGVPFDQYLLCVKGLANALWSLNNDFFPSIRDSKGRLKIVALLRPDIFDSLVLQNRNTKLSDNSVILDWRTNYDNFRNSNLFLLADRLFAVQQKEYYSPGKSWDYYFPFEAPTTRVSKPSGTSFIAVLRYSLHRPRDILAVLDVLEKLYVKTGLADRYFSFENLTSKEFRKTYGRYMLGEIKDSLSFYYSEKEYQLFLKFFEYLDGNQKFDYSKYLAAYADFIKPLRERGDPAPRFMESAEVFLQFLFDQNIICYIEYASDEKFFRWCFIERTPSNISPQVKTHLDYEIHYGLANALNTGKKIRSRQKTATAVVSPNRSGFFEGNVKFYKVEDRFGFIVQDGMPVDIFLHKSAILSEDILKKGDRVRFRLDKDKTGRLIAVDIMKVVDS